MIGEILAELLRIHSRDSKTQTLTHIYQIYKQVILFQFLHLSSLNADTMHGAAFLNSA